MTESSILPSTAAPVAVLLPGTGSDDVFVRRVFEIPLAAVGVRAITPAPRPASDVATAYLEALDEAAREHPGGVLAGGISFGAHVAAEWAVRNPERCAGLLLALPAWHGEPGDSPAAISARLGAGAVRASGLEAALSAMRDSAEAWVAEEIGRAWRGYGDGLADALCAAAERPAPTLAELGKLDVPVGVAACADDRIHPIEVARTWAGAFPNAILCTTRLEIMGVDPEALGRATVLAWLRAGAVPPLRD